MKTFDIITDEVWKLFDFRNENSNCNGKVSILKGNRKILIRVDENNYCVKYSTNELENLFGEFIINFNSDSNEYEEDKNNILKHLSKTNIYEWMNEIKFQTNLSSFKVNEYSIPFEIIQKSNNYIVEDISFNITQEYYNEVGKYASFSKASYSFNSNSVYNNSESCFFSSNAFISFFNDVRNFRYIKKYEKTSNICAIMRCLSMIEPLVDYFTCCSKKYKIFEKFPSFSLINLIGNFFSDLWNNEKTPYDPYAFISYIKNKTNINIYEEQDPFTFLNHILTYINNKLNKIDKSLNLNFNNIINEYKSKNFYADIKKIIEKKNSIIGKYFLGLIQENYKCNNNNCSNITTKINPFNIIDINYLEILETYQTIGNSFTSLKIDNLLEYYFLDKTLDNIEYPSINCSKCNKEAKIYSKKMLLYPKYLIIRLNIHEFHQQKESLDDSLKLNLNNDYDKIENLKNYCADEIKNNNIEYELINMINYLYNENNKLSFLIICKSEIYSLMKKIIGYHFILIQSLRN